MLLFIILVVLLTAMIIQFSQKFETKLSFDRLRHAFVDTVTIRRAGTFRLPDQVLHRKYVLRLPKPKKVGDRIVIKKDHHLRTKRVVITNVTHVHTTQKHERIRLGRSQEDTILTAEISNGTLKWAKTSGVLQSGDSGVGIDEFLNFLKDLAKAGKSVGVSSSLLEPLNAGIEITDVVMDLFGFFSEGEPGPTSNDILASDIISQIVGQLNAQSLSWVSSNLDLISQNMVYYSAAKAGLGAMNPIAPNVNNSVGGAYQYSGLVPGGDPHLLNTIVLKDGNTKMTSRTILKNILLNLRGGPGSTGSPTVEQLITTLTSGNPPSQNPPPPSSNGAPLHHMVYALTLYIIMTRELAIVDDSRPDSNNPLMFQNPWTSQFLLQLNNATMQSWLSYAMQYWIAARQNYLNSIVQVNQTPTGYVSLPSLQDQNQINDGNPVPFVETIAATSGRATFPGFATSTFNCNLPSLTSCLGSNESNPKQASARYDDLDAFLGGMYDTLQELAFCCGCYFTPIDDTNNVPTVKLISATMTDNPANCPAFIDKSTVTFWPSFAGNTIPQGTPFGRANGRLIDYLTSFYASTDVVSGDTLSGPLDVRYSPGFESYNPLAASPNVENLCTATDGSSAIIGTMIGFNTNVSPVGAFFNSTALPVQSTQTNDFLFNAYCPANSALFGNALASCMKNLDANSRLMTPGSLVPTFPAAGVGVPTPLSRVFACASIMQSGDDSADPTYALVKESVNTVVFQQRCPPVPLAPNRTQWNAFLSYNAQGTNFQAPNSFAINAINPVDGFSTRAAVNQSIMSFNQVGSSGPGYNIMITSNPYLGPASCTANTPNQFYVQEQDTTQVTFDSCLDANQTAALLALFPSLSSQAIEIIVTYTVQE